MGHTLVLNSGRGNSGKQGFESSSDSWMPIIGR